MICWSFLATSLQCARSVRSGLLEAGRSLRKHARRGCVQVATVGGLIQIYLCAVILAFGFCQFGLSDASSKAQESVFSIARPLMMLPPRLMAESSSCHAVDYRVGMYRVRP
eukprot:6210160-Pleurochrysis_carterae.AAC.1